MALFFDIVNTWIASGQHAMVSSAPDILIKISIVPPDTDVVLDRMVDKIAVPEQAPWAHPNVVKSRWTRA